MHVHMAIYINGETSITMKQTPAASYLLAQISMHFTHAVNANICMFNLSDNLCFCNLGS